MTGWVPPANGSEITVAQQHAAMRRMAVLVAEKTTGGHHLWVASVLFHVNPPLADDAIFDGENLLGPPLVGCLICEQPWHPARHGRACPGDPRHQHTEENK